MALRKRVLTQPAAVGDGPEGWTKWTALAPSPQRFTLVCCDCCLTHQHQFKIKTFKNGKQVVLMRVRRADLYTQAGRKRRRGIERLDKGDRIRAIRDGVYVAILPNELARGKKK